MKIVNLKCGYHVNPNQISREDVCFSWGTENAGDQKAYRLQISHDESFKRIYVDTEKISSSSNKYIRVKAKLSRATKYYWRVKVYSVSGDEQWSPTAHFETKHKDFDAKWIVNPKERDPYESAPCTRFRKDFNSQGKIKYARLYSSAQGNYVAYINGHKCGNQYLTPGWTEYKKRIQYQVFDVTELLTEGENCLSSVVSDGRFMGPVSGSAPNNRCRFGEQRSFFAQLEIDYEDESYITVITDSSWNCDRKSAYEKCEIYYGADYDSRLEDDFANPGYDSRNYAEEISVKSALIPEQGVPVRHVRTLKPLEIIKTPDGKTVVDMGQNMVGVPKLKVNGRLGQEIELRFFETLDKDGNIFTGNLRSARQGLNYITKSGENTFVPEMTYFGFRYIHVIKWPGEINKDNITGLVLSSDLDQTGKLKTNHELVNKLIENTIWSQIGNSVDIPTECPQRDERLGWVGDAQVFIKAAAFNFDVLTFYSKWLGDMSYAQRKNGSIPHVVPDVTRDENCSAGWGEACIIIPWQLYLRYGDIDILNKCYPMMSAFLDYRIKTSTDEGLINTGYHFGDWLALDSLKDLNCCWGSTPIDLISTSYFGYSAKIMENVASVLGKKSDENNYKKLFEKIKLAFTKEFLTPNKRLASHTHTAYVLALEFGMLDDKAKERAVKDLVNLIRDHNCITCGFMGAHHILDVLTDNGHHDIAEDFALKEDYPSWLFPVTMGATTIWEHWNSILPDGTINPIPMNSLNHCAYGSVVNWYYEKVAGIVPDPLFPGYKHFYLKPRPTNKLSEVDCNLKTHYGTIRVYFELSHSNVRMRLSVPDNTTAHLSLEDCKVYSLNCKRKKYSNEILLESGIHDVTYVKGGTFLSLVPET